MAADPRVREIVARDVEAVNARLARIEQVKRFDILERDLSQADGELTPTLKVKRALVYRAYADRFARLYEEYAAAPPARAGAPPADAARRRPP